MSATERRKGHDFERDIARRMREHYPHAERGIQSRDGADAPDVDGTPWFVECKHGRQVRLRGALRQAEEATDGRPPVVVVREHGNRDGEIVMMRWATFEAMVRGRTMESAPGSDPSASMRAVGDGGEH